MSLTPTHSDSASPHPEHCRSDFGSDSACIERDAVQCSQRSGHGDSLYLNRDDDLSSCGEDDECSGAEVIGLELTEADDSSKVL